MVKAKYIGRYSDKYDRDSITLEYEYRNETYAVHVHNTKGNEPLSWQHKNAQARIDHEIELEEKRKKSNFVGEPASKALDRFFEYLETGEWREWAK